MMNLKFSEIVQQNNKLAEKMNSANYSISILSNVILNQLNPVLEYFLRLEDIPAKCISGEYDNIIQDSQRLSSSNAIVIFWEMANLIDGFQYKANILDKTETEAIITRFKSEIDFVFQQLNNTSLVVVNRFSTIVFNHYHLKKNNFDLICDELNSYLTIVAPANAVIIDVDKVIAGLSVSKAVDFRNYYSSKSLYTVDFIKEYASYIAPIFRSVNGKTKKALIFDCDNTLWNGIIGEDGMDGVAMSASSPKGVVFEEVQFLARELAEKGILIGLNSKNNPEDVSEVISTHPDISLKDEHIIIKIVNWNEKAGNLKSIAQQLNIGIDSLVFVDDSDFEINLVKEFAPQVKTVQVPIEKYMYPDEIRKSMKLFYSKHETSEDSARVKMYKEELQREIVKSSFLNIEEYLKSLELQLKIYKDDFQLVQRISQLTQKTNQFNLTTKRYTEAEIKLFTDSELYHVFAFGIKDRFGDFGITGVAIVRLENEEAIFDTFLISCRILGRKIEIKFIDEILHYLSNKGVRIVRSSFIKTPKNAQVENFYEGIGFTLDTSENQIKNYSVLLEKHHYNTINFINTTYAR
jgi:FkbH-like protein